MDQVLAGADQNYYIYGGGGIMSFSLRMFGTKYVIPNLPSTIEKVTLPVTWRGRHRHHSVVIHTKMCKGNPHFEKKSG